MIIELKSKLEKKYWRILNEAYALLQQPMQGKLNELANVLDCSRTDLSHIICDQLIKNIAGQTRIPVYQWNSDLKPNIHMLEQLITNIRYRKQEWNQHAIENRKLRTTIVEEKAYEKDESIRTANEVHIINVTQTLHQTIITIDNKYRHLALELIKIELNK